MIRSCGGASRTQNVPKLSFLLAIVQQIKHKRFTTNTTTSTTHQIILIIIKIIISSSSSPPSPTPIFLDPSSFTEQL
jgi:hypothetical protein